MASTPPYCHSQSFNMLSCAVLFVNLPVRMKPHCQKRSIDEVSMETGLLYFKECGSNGLVNRNRNFDVTVTSRYDIRVKDEKTTIYYHRQTTSKSNCDAPVGTELIPHAGDLPCRKLSHAGVIRVVHEVVCSSCFSKRIIILHSVKELTDRVSASARTCVTVSRTSRSRGGLGRCVGNLISSGRATALECMVKTNPMPSFVSQCLPKSEQRDFAEGTELLRVQGCTELLTLQGQMRRA